MNIRLLLFSILVASFCSCGDGILRGEEVTSLDGQTYLVVKDDNGGGCGPILIDGVEWNFKINEPGKINPGVHTIECGGKIEFEIKEGTIFYFDYWGP